jgi:hypothetical protein
MEKPQLEICCSICGKRVTPQHRMRIHALMKTAKPSIQTATQNESCKTQDNSSHSGTAA